MPVLSHFSIPHHSQSQNTTFSTRNHIPVWKKQKCFLLLIKKAKIRPPSPSTAPKTTHKPVPSAQNPPCLRVGDQKKTGCGKRRDEEGSNNFQVSTKVPLFASGRRRRMPCADEERPWKEWEIDEGTISLVLHTGTERGEN
jgi:hypothetical protein